ncbi:DUF2975 domain-containing protein [Proteinivorax hydrogeniformans]|uniref:DUF2975 domain-containing protein n=1 Tax=Proteinivorax hydrogeniformans TaxID=1826727 RepID=A0AAU8HUS2_9FIRM
MNKFLLGALNGLLVLTSMIVLALCIFVLPNMADVTVELFPEADYLKYPILVGIYLTCIPFYAGIFQTFKLLNLIQKESAFTEKAAKSLGIISYCAGAVIAAYIAGTLYLGLQNALPPGVIMLGFTIIFTSFVIALFALVLKLLLIKVIAIKKENDLVI